MQDLQFSGIEDGALVLIADDGSRYRVVVDEELKATVRLAMPDRSAERRLSPREIQVLVRSGHSAAQIAEERGVALDYVQRFEGPVLAEREYVTDAARAVPVRTALDADPEASTFGDIIGSRLETVGAVDESWTSWKEESGWVVVLTFVVGEVEHDARWQFDPKRGALSPANAEAIRLSQQEQSPEGIIPRLRVVGQARPTDTSRFDSGAFLVDDPAFAAEQETDAGSPEPADAEADDDRAHTADLLEALRRRRGEREPAVYAEADEPASTPAPAGIRLVDVPMDDYFADDPIPSREPAEPAPPAPTATVRPARKGRASMPSWDDIVFGTRPDDDLV
ncbi:septation protein SepH [Galbitalea sp. SE-J8]|uniref:septation protein SepH n=1 Tax=Galbitalea sp. SE-J8 TaxID=3054952 RepID=UPI00259D1B87|nr:septation protein SepH [Galbitalea sp. SE-J8]MDM4763197.1 septation protein SepH [Galbitalea sp. SE-J8]